VHPIQGAQLHLTTSENLTCSAWAHLKERPLGPSHLGACLQEELPKERPASLASVTPEGLASGFCGSPTLCTTSSSSSSHDITRTSSESLT
jgi:hypothetical protein